MFEQGIPCLILIYAFYSWACVEGQVGMVHNKVEFISICCFRFVWAKLALFIVIRIAYEPLPECTHHVHLYGVSKGKNGVLGVECLSEMLYYEFLELLPRLKIYCILVTALKILSLSF